ncbi:hypothetical protein P879_09567 [Paragonimus westermani]|uniref:Uncharacterized protein n=1 Tax=Paragonimus westermani TaxID=34504 RepID=A0A8T0DHL9_9TREM|nr:hypothetical protein P879_09567 [Paragonimus westermani]
MNLDDSDLSDNDSMMIGFGALAEKVRNRQRIAEQQSTTAEKQFTEEPPEPREGSPKIIPQRIGDAKVSELSVLFNSFTLSYTRLFVVDSEMR